jgi:hypothetical protein
MRKSWFSEPQIVHILRQAEVGEKTNAQLCRDHGFSEDLPHSSLGYRTPREFRAAWSRGRIPDPWVTEGSPTPGP